ncbi:MAG: hypothetical protein L0216_01205 [Planctomycetales bacterium]|nr:hypothetical protein [Planctomycetales bacterium]
MARDEERDEYYGAAAEGGMQGFLQEQLQRTPWWMISIAVHAMCLLCMYFVIYQAPPSEKTVDVAMDVAPENEDPFEEEIKKEDDRDVDKDIKTDEPPIEDPVIKDAEVSDHNETDNNEEYEQSKGDENAVSDKPFQGKYWNDAIGVGGGAGGAYGGRFGGKRDLVARGGGGRGTEAAVAAGLRWLKNHQDPDGQWSCDNFQKNCKKNICEGKGSNAEYSCGVTGIALLAFLGAGNSMRAGPYKEVVKKGLKYLVSVQSPDGCLGPKTGDGHYMYNHLICTMALSEAYGLSGMTPQLKAPAQKAVEFMMQAQNPYLGWRYGIRPGDNDTSMTGWAVLALKSAKLSELEVPPEGFQGAKNWFDKVTDDSFYKTGYTQKGDNGARLPEAQKFAPSEAMTAVAVTSRVFMGEPSDSPKLKGGATLLKNMPPKWDPESTNDFYYWYYGTLAMFQMGGDFWKVWNTAMKEALVKTQRRGGDEDGSWDPSDAWGGAGGRVYSTAINILSLEIYYRYGKVLGAKKSGDGH